MLVAGSPRLVLTILPCCIGKFTERLLTGGIVGGSEDSVTGREDTGAP